MPLIVKPRTLGVMTKAERRPHGASLIVSAFGQFDLAVPNPDRFEDEQGLWLMVAQDLPPGAIFDIGMPKPTAEVLVTGYAAAPGGEATSRIGLGWAIGGCRKSLLVTGDRLWQIGAATATATEPRPFMRMPLTPARCFGGEGFAPNPAGAGFRARERLLAGEAVALPNIEIPGQAIRSIADRPDPAQFGPLAADARERLRHAGTYDAAWLRTRAPALPDDADPRLFLFAPEDQRLPTHLSGNEAYRLQGFSAQAPTISGTMPGFRVRCFVGWADPAKPVAELPMRIDTLWLFAGAGRGVLVYRGALPVDDHEGADVADVMLAYERPNEARLVADYLAVRALRTDPEEAFRHALADHQLSPRRSPGWDEARVAARQARDAARQAQAAENAAFVHRKMLAEAGLPQELWPEAPDLSPPRRAIPVPLPEEIADGSIDLAALLDALEDAQRDVEATLESLKVEQRPLREAMAGIASGSAGPDDIDRAMAALGDPALPASLDAAAGHLSGVGPLPPEASDQLRDGVPVEAVRDWRGAMLAAARPVVDEEAQLAKARARFLGLPEGGPLADLQAIVDGLSFSPPVLGDLPEEARACAKPARGQPFAEAMALLEHDGVGTGLAAGLRDGLGQVEASLQTVFPRLAAAPGGALAALIALDPPPDPVSALPNEAMAWAATDLASIRADLASKMREAETTMAANLAALRRSAPTPLAPDPALTPAVARSFAALILAESAAGLSLIGRDLAGADLAGADLSGLDLSDALLEGVCFAGARLTGARLAGATLCGADLTGADLSACDLAGANLAKVSASRARFEGAQLIGASLTGASFPEASFDGAILQDLTAIGVPFDRATFRKARIDGCVLMRCSLSRTDWSEATIARLQILDGDATGAVFAGAALTDTAFAQVRAGGADWSDARLTGVAFVGGTDLTRARFTRAYAERLSFQTVDATGAAFERARLDQACFVTTTLVRATFRAASLKRALLARNDLRGADCTAANLLEAHLNRADLRGAQFASANLFGADLTDAELTGADLSRANLGGTLFAVAGDA